MLSEKKILWGNNRNLIREIAEIGRQRKLEIGPENVFDYSIGNPSVPTPPRVQETLKELINGDPVAIHSYTNAAGDIGVRNTIAEHVNKQYGTKLTGANIYMTCGAAASLSICLHGLLLPGEECIIMAPYFMEYLVYVENTGAEPHVVYPDPDTFQIDMEAFKAALNEKTKVVLLNSPNNPSGVVYREESIVAMCDLLRQAEQEYGHPIYIVTDEPYRELVYDGVKVPYLMNYYKRSLVCYSYSKTLSLPGERIGYIAVDPEMEEYDDVYAAMFGAGRALGYINAPSLFQFLIGRCVDEICDVEIYRKNRDLLYGSLTELGFTCVHPDGAFYLFLKSPEPDAAAFAAKARKYELLLVPSNDFGVTGYCRLAYCVDRSMIEKSLPSFKKLAAEYGLQG